MGVIIQDKTTSYEGDFDAIISAASDPLYICYFGEATVPLSLRLGEFTPEGRKGEVMPTGRGALVADIGIQTTVDNDNGNPNRFIHSSKNASDACCLLVVAQIMPRAGVFSFAGTRAKVDASQKFSVKAADGLGRVTASTIPAGGVCFFLNSRGSSYDQGWINAAGGITKTNFSNPAKKFTLPDQVTYLGGVGWEENYKAPSTFYCDAAFDRQLTDEELSAQARQLIAYANSLGAGVA